MKIVSSIGFFIICIVTLSFGRSADNLFHLDKIIRSSGDHSNSKTLTAGDETNFPTGSPSTLPTNNPTSHPTIAPSSNPSSFPSSLPSLSQSSFPSSTPSSVPTFNKLLRPTAIPTDFPSPIPSTIPTLHPTQIPSHTPTVEPTIPTSRPSSRPTVPTSLPSNVPSCEPTVSPSRQPSGQPSRQPTRQPSGQPTRQPSAQPSRQPTRQPSSQPSRQPSNQPTSQPSRQPSRQPTGQPSSHPTAQPVMLPTGLPTSQPQANPSSCPSAQPSSDPTAVPTQLPTSIPSIQPSAVPTSSPTTQPTRQPSSQPSRSPTAQPSRQPTRQPTCQPSCQPSSSPSRLPTAQPSSSPTQQPTSQPSSEPSCQPSSRPTARPTSSAPTSIPSGGPTKYPTTPYPTSEGETNNPTSFPTTGPTRALFDYKNNSLYKMFFPMKTLLTSRSSSVSYASLDYKGVKLAGSCDDWQFFTQGSLRLPSEQFYFSRVTASFATQNLYTGRSTNETIFCDKVSFMSRLISSINAGTRFMERCYNHEWRAFTCNSKIVICANCKFSCGYDICPGRTERSISPCMDCSEEYISYSIIRFDISNNPKFPKFDNGINLLRRTSNSLTLNISFTSLGSAYCLALPVTAGPIIRPGTATVKALGAPFTILQVHVPLEVHLDGIYADTDHVVYCYSEDLFANAMDLVYMHNNSVVYRTSCCKRISFLNVVSPLSTASPKIFQLALNSKLFSTSPLTTILQLSAQSIACDSNQVINPPTVSVYPYLFPLTWSAYDTPISIPRFTLQGSAGCVLLTASDVSQPRSRFNSSSLRVRIVSNSSFVELQPPNIASAVFSADGRSILISFNTSTDRGLSAYANLPSSFDCRYLLSFDHKTSNNSRCSWLTPSSLKADLSFISRYLPPLEYVSVGDTVRLVPYTLKSLCVSTDDLCVLQSMSPFADGVNSVSSSVVTAPPNAARPQSVLSIPNQGSTCEDLIVDATASTGDGGRQWTSVMLSVELVSISNIEIIDLANFIKNFTDTQSLFTVPRRLLHYNTTLRFTLKLQNFLGGIGVSTKDVLMVRESPLVRLAGSPVVNMYRFNPLSLLVLAQASSCRANFTDDGSALTFKWQLYRSFLYLPELISSSKDPRMFTLLPYTLSKSSQYLIRVTAFQGTLSAFADVTVFVLNGPVQATIAGPPTRTQSVESVVSIDASSSRDLDNPSIPSSSYTDPNVYFSWTCTCLAPSLGTPCAHTLGPITADALRRSTLSLRATNVSSMTSPRIYNFSVVVSTGDGTSDSAFVLVTVLKSSLPDVVISNLVRINQEEKLILDGKLTLTTGHPSKADIEWSCQDNFGEKFPLSNVSLSELTRNITWLPSIRDSSFSTSSQLAIKPYSLSPGMSYSFSLSVAYYYPSSDPNSFGRGVATIHVDVNAPPSGGILHISPSEGIAFNTTFLWSTKYWVDDLSDYPISYTMSFKSLISDSPVIVRTSYSLPYATSTMNAGNIVNSYNVTCTVTATDSFGASSGAFTSVRVTPTSDISVLKDRFAAEALFGSKSSNPNVVFLAITGAAHAINLVNCTQAPSCSNLNRNPCSTVPHTCGLCLNGLVGENGDANSMCISMTPSLSVNRKLDDSPFLALGEPCSSNSSCLSGRCAQEICQDSLKMCPNNCDKGRSGKCVFLDINNVPLIECGSSDALCRAVCFCNTGKFGRDCTSSYSQHQLALSFRENLCASVKDAITLESQFTEQSLFRYIHAIELILVEVSELSDSALTDCASNLLILISIDPELSTSEDSLTSILNSVSSILEVSNTQTLSTLLQDQLLQILSTVSLGRQLRLAVDETLASSFSTNSLRFAVQKVSVDSVYNSKLILAPQMLLEQFNRLPQASITLEFDVLDASLYESCDSVGATVLQYNRNPRGAFTNSTSVKFLSNCHTRTTSTSQTTSTVVQSLVTMTTLQNHEPVDYFHREPYNVIITCDPELNQYSMKPNCSEDLLREATCPGSFAFGSLNVTCPGRREFPVCTSWTGSQFAPDAGCHYISFTPSSTTCRCSRPSVSTFSSPQNDVHEFYKSALSSSRRQLLTSAGGIFLQEISSQFAVTAEKKFEYKFLDLGAYAIQDVIRDQTIYLCSYYLIVISIVGLVAFALIDAIGSYHVSQANKKDELAAIEAKNSGVVGHSKRHRLIKPFIESILPSQFIYKHWHLRFVDMICREHDWVFLFTRVRETELRSKSTAFNSSRPENESIVQHNNSMSETRIPARLERWVAACGRVISIFFISTVFSVYFFADDGICQEINNKTECEAQRSIFIVSSLCTWDIHIRSCYFNTPDRYFIPVLIAATIVLILVILLDKVIRYCTLQTKILISECMHGGRKVQRKIRNRKPRSKNIIVKAAPDGAAMMQSKSIVLSQVDEGHTVLNPGAGLGMKAAVSLSHNDIDDAEDIADEFKYAQRRPTMLMQAARLTVLHKNIDFLNPEEEVLKLLADKTRNWHEFIPPHHSDSNILTTIRHYARSFLFLRDEIGDPLTASQLMYHGCNTSKEILIEKLKHSRLRSEGIKAKLFSLERDEERDAYLLKRFLVDTMPGARRVIAYYFFFGADEDFEHLKEQWLLRAISVIVLPVYLIAAMYYVLTEGVATIGTRASSIWLFLVLACIIFDALVLQPLKIWIKWIVILTTTDSSIRQLHSCLKTRARTILRRRRGLMVNLNSLIQHFNPACRAARFYPQLPSARLLLGLTDFDLPLQHHITHQTKKVRPVVFVSTNSPLLRDKLDALGYNTWILLKSWVRFGIYFSKLIACAALVIFMRCNDFIHDAFLEVVVVAFVNTLLLALYLTSGVHIGMTIACVVLISGGIILRIYVHKHEIVDGLDHEKVPPPEVDFSVVRYLPNNRFAVHVSRHQFNLPTAEIVTELPEGIKTNDDESSLKTTIKAIEGPPLVNKPTSESLGVDAESRLRISRQEKGYYSPTGNKLSLFAGDIKELRDLPFRDRIVGPSSSIDHLDIGEQGMSIAGNPTGFGTLQLEEVTEQPYSVYEKFKGDPGRVIDVDEASFNRRRRHRGGSRGAQDFIESEVRSLDFNTGGPGTRFAEASPKASAADQMTTSKRGQLHRTMLADVDNHGELTDMKYLFGADIVNKGRHSAPAVASRTITGGPSIERSLSTTNTLRNNEPRARYSTMRQNLSRKHLATEVPNFVPNSSPIRSPSPPSFPQLSFPPPVVDQPEAAIGLSTSAGNSFRTRGLPTESAAAARISAAPPGARIVDDKEFQPKYPLWH